MHHCLNMLFNPRKTHAYTHRQTYPLTNTPHQRPQGACCKLSPFKGAGSASGTALQCNICLCNATSASHKGQPPCSSHCWDLLWHTAAAAQPGRGEGHSCGISKSETMDTVHSSRLTTHLMCTEENDALRATTVGSSTPLSPSACMPWGTPRWPAAGPQYSKQYHCHCCKPHPATGPALPSAAACGTVCCRRCNSGPCCGTGCFPCAPCRPVHC